MGRSSPPQDGEARQHLLPQHGCISSFSDEKESDARFHVAGQQKRLVQHSVGGNPAPAQLKGGRTSRCRPPASRISEQACAPYDSSGPLAMSERNMAFILSTFFMSCAWSVWNLRHWERESCSATGGEAERMASGKRVASALCTQSGEVQTASGRMGGEAREQPMVRTEDAPARRPSL